MEKNLKNLWYIGYLVKTVWYDPFRAFTSLVREIKHKDMMQKTDGHYTKPMNTRLGRGSPF